MTTQTPMACGRCGLPHERCTAHNRAGAPCGLWPLRGQSVCHLHGGKQPAALAKAAERLAEAEADAVVRKLWAGLDQAAPVTDPVRSLQKLAGSLEQMADVLGERVNEMKTIEAGENLSAIRGHQVALDKTIGHLRSALADMVRLGIAQQQLALERDKARMVALAVSEALDEIGVSVEQREVFTSVMVSRMRVLEADGSAGPGALGVGV